ncbi:ubiquitin C [Sarotherodon galilaeus]
MAEDVAVSEETLTDGLTLLVNMGKVLLHNAKEEAADSLENFVPHKITTLFGLITAGAKFYSSIEVKKKCEAEAVWQKSCHNAAVREQVQELQQLEKEWDSFLESVDKDLQTTDVQLSGGKTADSLSPETLFTDGRSGNVEGAQLWLEQTGCTFDILLDPQRKVYRSFGLGSSYAKVMKFGCLLQYSDYVVANIDFPDFPHRLLEDIYQLGGDFLLDSAGKVLLSHPSKSPLDRPTVEDVLQTVDSAGQSANSAYKQKL